MPKAFEPFKATQSEEKYPQHLPAKPCVLCILHVRNAYPKLIVLHGLRSAQESLRKLEPKQLLQLNAVWFAWRGGVAWLDTLIICCYAMSQPRPRATGTCVLEASKDAHLWASLLAGGESGADSRDRKPWAVPHLIQKAKDRE